MSTDVCIATELPGLPVRRGKVRDIYDLGDQLLLVSTDRISAFDWVLPTGIPDKGRVLTQLSRFWFEFLQVPHHLLSCDPADFPLPPHIDRGPLMGRSMLVRKTDVVPIECVARGYLAGSGWQEYQASGRVCGVALPDGLLESDALPEPIFTPATKAEQGDHDENISFQRVVELVGDLQAESLRQQTLAIYRQGAEHARSRGLLIADTKFEFGTDGDQLILIDEVMTPDSSRFWPAARYQPGGPQFSFDKQFVRDWLTECGWDRNSPPPELPRDVVDNTRQKYIDAFEQISGTSFPWR